MAARNRQQPVLLTLVFALVCVISAIALVEWGQLQIEQSTWAQHARIEQVATEELSLLRPSTADIFVIERP